MSGLPITHFAGLESRNGSFEVWGGMRKNHAFDGRSMV